jgi:DNA-binding MarR family transcriptional regulator
MNMGRSLPLDDHVCFALYDGIHNMQRIYRPWFTEWGITYPQYLVLVALWDCSDGSMSVKQLGDHLHLDSGTLSPLLKRMESAGLVHRSRSPEDNRRVTVELTDSSRALQHDAAVMQIEVARAVGVTQDEADKVRSLARRIGRYARNHTD